MQVLVKASVGWQRRNRDRTLQCKLTWDQLLQDLAGLHEGYGFTSYQRSKRALAYWLEELEDRSFIHRATEDTRNALGQIVYRLTTFTFGINGILWIKNCWREGSALVDRSIVQKIALRFKSDIKKETKEQRAVDKSIHSSTAKPTKKSVLRRRTRASISSRAAPRPKKRLSEKRARPSRSTPGRRTARSTRRKRARK